jgi:dethiobiotin synthetase|tara:strand:- start:16320 stop:17000 length:681 start_codon:yes stop_codon:yes gene_type:complete
MSKSYFITGTSTGVGKTYVATGMLVAASRLGLSTSGFKPVAAGCEMMVDGLRSSDAIKLLAQTSLPVSYEQLNPVALKPEIAPHIAAAEIGRRLSVDRLVGFYRGLMMQGPDFCVVEGAGGWRVPLNERETLADLAKALKLPVVLVVGMDLGCINHALLTCEAIQKDGLILTGWIANQIVPEMDRYKENISTLRRWIPSPMLGELTYQPRASVNEVADRLDITTLL